MTNASAQIFPGDLAQLRSFYYAALYRSFTRAAERLMTTQPSVSTHVKGLEQLVGHTLFVRHARGATLTEAGQAMFELVEPLIEGIDQLQVRLAERLGSSSAQEIRLAAGHELLLHLAGPALRSYRDAHSDVRIVVYSSSRRETGEMVDAGEVDFGIAARAEAAGHVVFEHIFSDELLLICPEDHPLARQTSVSLEDLAGYPMLMPNPASSTRASIEEAFARAGRELRVAMELERWHVIKEFVALHQGIALVPGFSVAGESNRLAVRPVRGGLPPLTYGILRRKGRHLPAAVRDLIDAIRIQGGTLQAEVRTPFTHP